MDEIKDPTQDTSHIEDSSEKGKESTSETDTKTYTVESEKKAVSDALSAAGRDAKTLSEKTAKAEGLLQDAQKLMDKAKEQQKKRDEAALEDAKDDPERLSALQEKQAHQGTKAKLTQVEQELETERGKSAEAEKKTAEHTKEQNAREVAARLSVDYKPLMDFTDGSKEAMEVLAKSLPQKGEPKAPLKTDSSTTIGGALSDDALIKKSASGEFLSADEQTRIKQILGNLKGKLV